MYDMILILSLTNKEDRCDACMYRVCEFVDGIMIINYILSVYYLHLQVCFLI